MAEVYHTYRQVKLKQIKFYFNIYDNAGSLSYQVNGVFNDSSAALKYAKDYLRSNDSIHVRLADSDTIWVNRE